MELIVGCYYIINDNNICFISKINASSYVCYKFMPCSTVYENIFHSNGMIPLDFSMDTWNFMKDIPELILDQRSVSVVTIKKSSIKSIRYCYVVHHNYFSDKIVPYKVGIRNVYQIRYVLYDNGKPYLHYVKDKEFPYSSFSSILHDCWSSLSKCNIDSCSKFRNQRFHYYKFLNCISDTIHSRLKAYSHKKDLGQIKCVMSVYNMDLIIELFETLKVEPSLPSSGIPDYDYYTRFSSLYVKEDFSRSYDIEVIVNDYKCYVVYLVTIFIGIHFKVRAI